MCDDTGNVALLTFFERRVTMNVVYPICCSVDVHKTFLVSAIISTDGIQPRYLKKHFSTFNGQIRSFKHWLNDHDCHDVCMESTGKYWVPVFNILEDSINVTIANPKWVKAVKGNKDDTKDSKWIGDLFRLGLIPESYIPSSQFAFSVSLLVIAINLYLVALLKKIAFRIPLLFVMLHLMQLLVICLVFLLLRFLNTCFLLTPSNKIMLLLYFVDL